ncbi:MAG: tRNA glutamyl-Q(34) synthetase GluQRS [Actinomycetota bacterium]|nr:tRNA glutamyl-Q(34) synthetase GluQRS [Actinomycetota bacterium]
MTAGRFAPSPSGDLHVGNLRTALLAWLFARSTGRDFLMRIEDLDRVRPGAEERQLADLRAIGIDWDGAIIRQSDRGGLYADALKRLSNAGLTYECFCSRKEIHEAPSAPHHPPGAYPGTCRELTDIERAARRLHRPAALRLRAGLQKHTVTDALRGQVEGAVDDIVLMRNDGVPAYNLAVVVDDAGQRVDQVVRGDDLLSSAPRQAYLASLLGYPEPTYAHVPLALNARGQRLAKRDGAVTVKDLAGKGLDAGDVRRLILDSLGMSSADPAEFDPATLPREPWVFEPPA